MSQLFSDKVYTLKELAIGTLVDNCFDVDKFCNGLNLPEHIKDGLVSDMNAVIDRYFESFIEPDIKYKLPNEY